MTTKQHAPATDRNRDPILAVLQRVLPSSGKVLEIASGTGQHAVYFSSHFPQLLWQPTDVSEEALVSIRAWRESEGGENLLEPVLLDVTSDDWGVESVDAVVCINMIHISPWEACEGLFRGASRLLPSQAPMYLYGPYKVGGEHTAPSNQQFDMSLKMRDPAWGVRDMDDVKELAGRHGFAFVESVAMPANNFSVIFRRQ